MGGCTGTDRRQSQLCRALFGLGLALSVVRCTEDRRLAPLDQLLRVSNKTAEAQVDFCTQPPVTINTKKKYIFVLDKSGSNVENYVVSKFNATPRVIDVPGGLGTDVTPDPADPTGATKIYGQKRYQSLIDFLASQPANDAMQSYALINFNSNVSVRYNVSTNRDNFLSLVQADYDATRTCGLNPSAPGCDQARSGLLADGGGTNYKGALDAVQSAIRGDASNANANFNSDPIAATYIVVFLSDGFPVERVDRDGNGQIVATVQTEGEILEKVRAIKSVQKEFSRVVDDIVLFTGYYYVSDVELSDGTRINNEDPSARSLLAHMADEGGGTSFEYGTGQNIDYSYFSVPPRTVEYLLSNVLVANASTVWANDGKMLERDSDGDGLADSIELASAGSFDPAKADSNGNGVSDLLEYRGISGSCSIQDTDKDGLNDCEEGLLQNPLAGARNPDTNGDYIPDGLQYRNGLNFIQSPSLATNDPDFDGMVNFTEIQRGLPALLSNAQILNPLPYNYLFKSAGKKQINPLDPAEQVECYRLKVSNITVIGEQNEIRAYFFERSAVFGGPSHMHIARKILGAGESSVIIPSRYDEPVGPPSAWEDYQW